MVAYSPPKATKKGCLLGEGSVALSPCEKEVLRLLTQEFLTRKQIRLRRGITRQAVDKIVNSLIKKGALDVGFNQVAYSPHHSPPLYKEEATKKIRLHAQQLHIRILWKDQRYFTKLAQSNKINLDGNTIILYPKTVEIYSGQSFLGKDAQEATAESINYWNRFLARLEHELAVILVKPRSQNVRFSHIGHYAEIGNELAKQCNLTKDVIKVYTTDEGKLWFTIDNSFNLHEAETLEPTTSKEDMQEVVQPFFNDLRDNRPPTLTDVYKLVYSSIHLQQEQSKLVKEIALGLASIVKLMGITDKPQEQETEKEDPGYFG